MIDYEQIKQLKALRREAEGLKYSIDHAKPEIVTDYYKDYRTGKGIPKSLIGVDFDWKDISSRERRLKRKLDEISKLIEAIEREIDTVGDPDTRTILRMYYIEERSQEEVADVMHCDRTTVSKRLKKLATNATKKCDIL